MLPWQCCEHGYVGFTQPRVAARAGVRQSHLTYCFPTRADLLVAVAGAAARAQLAVADALLEGSSPEAAASIARLVAQAENTRVLLALVCAADDVPGVREVFRALADGMVVQGRKMLAWLEARDVPEAPYLLHALSVVWRRSLSRPGGPMAGPGGPPCSRLLSPCCAAGWAAPKARASSSSTTKTTRTTPRSSTGRRCIPVANSRRAGSDAFSE
jgi:AcrR family transcriptional regulator